MKNLYYRYRSLIIPLILAILSFLWLVFDLSFESVITFITFLTSTIVVYNKIKKGLEHRTDNYIYTLHIRHPNLNIINSCVKAILESEPAILSWKIYHLDGEFKNLLLKSTEKIDIKLVSEIILENKCKLYWINLGNQRLWENKAF